MAARSPSKPARAARTPAQVNARARESVRATAERVALQDAFLLLFSRGGIVLDACERVGVGRRTVYDWLEADDAFRRRYQDAREDATDRLEGEATRRAMQGVPEPVYQGGELVGHIVKYSDRLHELLLKAHRPDKFRERYEHTGANGGPIAVTKRVTFGGRYKPTPPLPKKKKPPTGR
jgi:hypothetical protein